MGSGYHREKSDKTEGQKEGDIDNFDRTYHRSDMAALSRSSRLFAVAGIHTSPLNLHRSPCSVGRCLAADLVPGGSRVRNELFKIFSCAWVRLHGFYSNFCAVLR